jgi:hypothetical protein
MPNVEESGSAIREVSSSPTAVENTNASGRGRGAPANVVEPSAHVSPPPSSSIPPSTSASGASCSRQAEEVPLGLIEDDLLGTDLCNDVLSSLRRFYKHHKIIPLIMRCSCLDLFLLGF